MTAKNMFFLIIVTLFVLQTSKAALLNRRSIAENVEDINKPEICQRNTPCGWAVYTKYTRVIDYFMKNKCECPEDKKCIRTDDDISVAAYVYRCKDGTPKDTDNS